MAFPLYNQRFSFPEENKYFSFIDRIASHILNIGYKFEKHCCLWFCALRSYFIKLYCTFPMSLAFVIPANPLHNHDIVSVHFNHFYCMGICNKLNRHLSMLTYIYLKVDECGLTSSMP